MFKVKTESVPKVENKEKSEVFPIKHVRKYKYSELFQEIPGDPDNVLLVMFDS